MDGRSDDKGLEVESLTIASVCDKHYLFVGAERTSTIFVFDITVKGPHARIVHTCQRTRTSADEHTRQQNHPARRHTNNSGEYRILGTRSWSRTSARQVISA